MRDALTAAREWHAQPLEMLGLPSRTWSEANRLLAQALTLHDADLCPGGCGMYLDESSDIDGWHELHKTVCDGCAARDRDDEKPQPGELRYVVDTRKGLDLPEQQHARVVAQQRVAASDGALDDGGGLERVVGPTVVGDRL